MINKQYIEHYPWMYKYDDKVKVWRAFYEDEIEVNQFHKEELLFVMSKYKNKTEWDLLPAIIQVPTLSEKERKDFLFYPGY